MKAKQGDGQVHIVVYFGWALDMLCYHSGSSRCPNEDEISCNNIQFVGSIQAFLLLAVILSKWGCGPELSGKQHCTTSQNALCRCNDPNSHVGLSSLQREASILQG